MERLDNGNGRDCRLIGLRVHGLSLSRFAGVGGPDDRDGDEQCDGGHTSQYEDADLCASSTVCFASSAQRRKTDK